MSGEAVPPIAGQHCNRVNDKGFSALLATSAANHTVLDDGNMV